MSDAPRQFGASYAGARQSGASFRDGSQPGGPQLGVDFLRDPQLKVRRGLSRRLLILCGMSTLVVMAVVAVTVAVNRGGGSTPTAQSIGSGLPSHSGGTSLSKQQQCAQIMGPLVQQFQQVNQQIIANPQEASTLTRQIADAYAQAAKKATSDPPLASALSSTATDLQKMQADETAENDSAFSADAAKVGQDIQQLEQVCGVSNGGVSNGAVPTGS